MANTKVAIIAANGTLFDAYKVFNVATAAAASDAEVGIFFTFEGLNLIHKEGHKNLPLPEGKEHFEEGFKQANVPSIEELVGIAQELRSEERRVGKECRCRGARESAKERQLEVTDG